MKKRLIIAGGSILLLLGLLAGAFLAVPLLVSAHSSQSAAATQGTPTINPYCVQYQQDLAKRLGVSVNTLQQDRRSAFEDELAQKVKDGKLTQTQANMIKARVESRPACSAKGHRSEHRFIGQFLRKYRTDIATQVAQGLHISTDTLTQQLKAGKSLSQIAQAQNVSATQLHTLVLNAIQSAESKAVSAGNLTQAQATAFTTFLQQHPNYLNRVLNHHAGTHSK